MDFYTHTEIHILSVRKKTSLRPIVLSAGI
uniref:Uncharacterized protein n=1 Tax=Anguilla anguilla TaxID=7936 RepID=A0A0E9RH25_ANGAN